MALRSIDKTKPLFMSPHRTLLNNVRSVAKLENLIKKHESYLAEFGIHDVPQLLAPILLRHEVLQCGRILFHR